MNYPRGPTPFASTIAKDSSYEKWTKDDLSQMINDLHVSELQKHFLRSRLLDQVLWMEKKASHAQRWYNTLRLIAIIGSVIVPALLGVSLASNQFVAGFIQWTTLGLSMMVALSLATESFFHFEESWRLYRSTAERLKLEWWQFFQLAGPYRESKDHAEAFSSFATRVESTHQQQSDVFLNKATQTEDKQEQVGFVGENGFQLDLNKMEALKQYVLLYDQVIYEAMKNFKGELELTELLVSSNSLDSSLNAFPKEQEEKFLSDRDLQDLNDYVSLGKMKGVTFD